MLDVNCHECGKEFAIDEYLLEFYFECQIVCPTCAKNKQEARNVSYGEGIPAVS